MTASEDELVCSFGCRVVDFAALIATVNVPIVKSENLLFELLDSVISGKSAVSKILIREIPLSIDINIPSATGDLIIPHLGDLSYLKGLINFLPQLPQTQIMVGIDQEISNEMMRIRNSNPDIAFYNFEPHPVGPYVIRNRLIDQSHHHLIFFQDTDDIPCADRFDRLAHYMSENNCQFCGSYELRLDEYHREARAIRYPVNVVNALNAGPHHALLHPSSAITREAFHLAGKLSEERTFANDTKFLLRSYFLVYKIMNIDAFLYIRRKRPGSLTTAPETMLGSPARNELLHRWNYDFERIKRGMMRLEESSLNPVSTALDVRFGKI